MATDDDPKGIERLTAALELEGFQVVKAYGGEEGVEFAMEEQPDIIILDLLMPGMNGFELMNNLEETPVTKGFPITIFTVKHLTTEERERLRGEFQGWHRRKDRTQSVW